MVRECLWSWRRHRAIFHPYVQSLYVISPLSVSVFREDEEITIQQMSVTTVASVLHNLQTLRTDPFVTQENPCFINLNFSQQFSNRKYKMNIYYYWNECIKIFFITSLFHWYQNVKILNTKSDLKKKKVKDNWLQIQN